MESGARPPLVRVHGLVHAYAVGDRRVVSLRGLDLDLAAGERLAVVGRSGSGKTTLLNVLAGLEKPAAGEVVIAGHDLTRLSARARAAYRRRVAGYVWQEPEAGLLPGLTVLQNVLVPMLAEPGSRQERAAAATQLLDMLRLGGALDETPGDLTAADLQRLALAVALANEPPLLLADELTARLEWPAARELLEDLETVLDETDTAAILVTHDQRLQSHVDRAISIRDGAALDAAVEAEGALAGWGRAP